MLRSDCLALTNALMSCTLKIIHLYHTYIWYSSIITSFFHACTCMQHMIFHMLNAQVSHGNNYFHARRDMAFPQDVTFPQRDISMRHGSSIRRGVPTRCNVAFEILCYTGTYVDQ